MNTTASAGCRIATILACLLVAAPRAQQRPPSSSEIKKLITSYLELDGRTQEGYQERAAILTKLEAVPPLTSAQIKSWSKEILKADRKVGRKLEKTGDNWFWDDKGKRRRDKEKGERRGRYVVAGQTNRPKALLIGMHGGGVGQGDAGASAGGWASACSKYKLVGIFPEVLEKTECGWTDSGTEEFVMDLVDAAIRTWKIDPDHVYFGGHSMGGYGSWTLGAHHADRVAAVLPAAGGPTPILERGTDRVLDLVKGITPNLRNVFTAAYQSIDDPKVPPGPQQEAVRRLIAHAEQWGGYQHDYWEVDGRGHDRPPGGTAAHFARVADKVRNPVPERVVWQPDLSWKRQFYWLYWEKPIRHATLVADFDRQSNTIKIECDKPTDGLWVLVDDRLADLGKEIVVLVNDKEVFKGKAEPRLTTLLLTGERPDPKLQFPARVPAHQ